MSVKTTLLIDDKEINVLWFNYAFNKQADSTGRPATKANFLGIQLAIETRKDLNLADWSFSPTQTKQLELHISPVILGGRTRKLNFYDCHLLKWGNQFSDSGSEPMHEVIHISAAGVKDSFSSAEYSTYWRTTFDQDDVAPTVIDNQEEPEIIDCYYTDLEGNREVETRIGEEVYLVLETENYIGKTINIDLSDNSKDFEHNGEVLENDIITNFSITSDLHKIKLRVIMQEELDELEK